MAATLLQMRNRIILRTGRKAGIDDQINFNINQATLYVVRKMRPKEMQTSTTFSTADGDMDYSIGTGGDIAVTNLYAVEMVRNNTDQYRLTRGTYQELENSKQDSTGKPHKWVHRGNTLFIYDRVPDATARTLKVSYLKRPTDLSADADSFGLNDEWIAPVEDLATAMTFKDLNDAVKMQQYYSAAKILLDDAEKPEAIEDEAPDGQVIMVSNGVDD